MQILLTGFNPFGANEVNPSQIIVQTLAERYYDSFELVAEILPTIYNASAARMDELLTAVKPDAVVMLGLASARSVISLERVALNLNDASVPDNDGDLRQGCAAIDLPDTPLAYATTLPIDAMLRALRERNIPAHISNHAGAFVCNHIFYMTRYHLENSSLATPCGFIHVPPIASSAEDTGLPLETLLDGIETCLNVIATYANY